MSAGLVKLAALPVLALMLGLLALASLFTLLGGVPAYPQDFGCDASPAATQEIPADYLRLYHQAGEGFGLDWAVLAAIGRIESQHGINLGPSSAGAVGPMQFLPSTWSLYGQDGDGDGQRDIMSPADAIPAAGALLRANGAPANWQRAIFAYNHADWYVRDVLAQAARYRGACTTTLAVPSPADGGHALAWPVSGPITSPYCERRPWERCHPGIDIAVPAGTPVRAAARGTVTLARPVAGYGNYICVTHTRRLTTCYAHLSEYLVTLGASVGRGEVIALSGCTGRCFGPHLHFEVRRGATSEAPTTDPLAYLGGHG